MTAPDIRTRLLAALARPGRPTSDFDLNPALAPDATGLRPAGVLVAIEETAQGPVVWLTKRASHLKHHPGQIAFAGGKVDPCDTGPVAAALREAQEEIGLDPASVEVLGQAEPHQTVTGFAVTPVYGLIRGPFRPLPEAGEVDEAFAVPLSHLGNPANYRIEGRIWRGQKRLYYTVPHGPYYIWGATARILRAMADRLTQ